jgi:nitroimidazol reductase NimA-like FMN-containing flavoprotein (pyridoxamine 5'-phosphate oxidase superfamily)
MTYAEAEEFLAESRSVIRIGTVDDSGDPNIHPVWYFFEPKGRKLYAFVGRTPRRLGTSGGGPASTLT